MSSGVHEQLRLDDAASDGDRSRLVSDLAGRAIAAALAEPSDERAWSLVRLADELRMLDRPDVALRALDAAWELRPSEAPRRAIFTCAIASHCDLGQHVLAEAIEREQASRSVDEDFARQALRLYSALSRLTGLDVHLARRAHYISLLNGSLSPSSD